MSGSTAAEDALRDIHRSAKLAITEGQNLYSLGRLGQRPLVLSRFFENRARERLQSARYELRPKASRTDRLGP